MKKYLFYIIVILTNITNVSANSSDKISCHLANDFDSYTIEVVGEKAAFFDNNEWSPASYLWTLESSPSINVYESLDQSDPFTIYIKEFQDRSETAEGRLSIKINDRERNFPLICKKVSKLIYLGEN